MTLRQESILEMLFIHFENCYKLSCFAKRLRLDTQNNHFSFCFIWTWNFGSLWEEHKSQMNENEVHKKIFWAKKDEVSVKALWLCSSSDRYSPAFHHGDPVSIPGQIMWDLWCAKWHWVRLPPSISVSSASFHSIICCILTYSQPELARSHLIQRIKKVNDIG
jgi:hypothetical protein